MRHLPTSTRVRQAFTLVELLTVVAIISLLIGILMPSLSKARDQAKRARTLAMLDSIGKSLEMFHNDFNEYPDSRLRVDPVTDWPTIGTTTPPDGAALSGAHWLARALVGHDSQGPDAGKMTVTDGGIAANQREYKDVASLARKGPYFEGKVFVRDDDPSTGLVIPTPSGSPRVLATGRMIVIDDSFKSPILYYRANQRASNPFCLDGKGTAAPGSATDMPGVYRLQDNAPFTGDQVSSLSGWDFGATGIPHWLSYFGVLDASNPQRILTEPTDGDGNPYKSTFARYLHDSSALNASGLIKAARPDTFVLISAGKDGVYGTDDDINNFSTAR